MSAPQPDRLARLIALAPALTVAIALAIAVITLMPMPHIPGPRGGDKGVHLVAFAALVFPIGLASPRRLLWLVPLAIAYGGAIELIQPHVGRSREFADLVADGTGALIGAALGLTLNLLLFRRGR